LDNFEPLFPRCSLHGKPTKRDSCRECNAAYMRSYLRERRRRKPERPLWERARKRAKDRGLPFDIPKDAIVVPRTCPALGLVIELRGQRSACSPSLDRIVPERGYVSGNIRVISDRANRLKGGTEARCTAPAFREWRARSPRRISDGRDPVASDLDQWRTKRNARAA